MFRWILESLADPRTEVPALPVVHGGRDALACRVPDTNIEVVWRLQANGKYAILLIAPIH